MNLLPRLYRHSLALLTDLYQLTMAYAYWKNGLAEREAVFHLTFRQNPFGGQYAVACGLSCAVDFLRELRFTDDDLSYLATLATADGRSLFETGFLDYLRGLEFCCDVDAVVEGTVVFAGEPLVRVRGPLLQSQIVETPLLTLVNFPTLIATKAARVCLAAAGRPVLEFGLRRAQGIDGGLTASRAAYIGGCAATSNVLAGKLFGIPVKGTHAHSWVMAFDDERRAFEAYAAALPGNCIFLVDTYDSISGVRNAIAVAGNCAATAINCSGSAWIRGISWPSAANRDSCWTKPVFRRPPSWSAATWTNIASSNCCATAPAPMSGESARGWSPVTISPHWAACTSCRRCATRRGSGATG